MVNSINPASSGVTNAKLDKPSDGAKDASKPEKEPARASDTAELSSNAQTKLEADANVQALVTEPTSGSDAANLARDISASLGGQSLSIANANPSALSGLLEEVAS